LRMVSSYLGLLQLRYREMLDENGKIFIGFALDGARRMTELIENLLQYARIGASEFNVREVNCAALIQSAKEDLNLALQECGATVTCDPLPLVKGDEVQLRRVFENLIHNAIKYRDPSRAPRIHISSVARIGECWFTFRDNGIGIQEEDANKLFELFYRSGGRHNVGGSGMGLAICKRIVEKHGGRITAENNEEGGTNFSFSLPSA
jgi:signal transduction histidine kinase